MFKRFSAIFLLLILGFNYAVFAEDNWQFAEPVSSNQYSTVNPYESGNTYTPYVTSPNNMYVDVDEDNDYSYSGHVYTNTQNQANVSKKKDGTFSENHPVITGIGVGALVVGVLALGWLLSDNDKEHHRDDSHDKAFSHHDNHGHHTPPPPKHHGHQHDYSHNYR